MTSPIRMILVAATATSAFALAPVASATSWHHRAANVVVAGGETTLALDSGAAGALQSLGVAVAPIAPASAGSGGISFPISGGLVNGNSLQGRIGHSGGLTFSKGSTKVDLRRFTIKIDKDPDLSGIVSVNGQRVGRVELFSLDLSKLKVDRTEEDIQLSGVTLKLTKGAAGALNGAFGVTAFTEGLLIGSATTDTDILGMVRGFYW
jgi:hypothetical protein